MHIGAYFKSATLADSADGDVLKLTFHVRKEKLLLEDLESIFTLQGNGVELSATKSYDEEYMSPKEKKEAEEREKYLEAMERQSGLDRKKAANALRELPFEGSLQEKEPTVDQVISEVDAAEQPESPVIEEDQAPLEAEASGQLDGASTEEEAEPIQERGAVVYEDGALNRYAVGQAQETDLFIVVRKDFASKKIALVDGLDPCHSRHEAQRLLDDYAALKGFYAVPASETESADQTAEEAAA